MVKLYTMVKRKPILISLLILGLAILSLAAYFGPPVLNQVHARNEITARDNRILQVLKQHPVKVVISDTSRLLQIEHTGSQVLHYSAVSSCSKVTSGSKPENLYGIAFAYVLQYDKLNKYAAVCPLESVVKLYGRPSVSVVIAGTVYHPAENLLLYDHGVSRPMSSTQPLTTPLPLQPATVVPISLTALPKPLKPCIRTTVNIVAHQDDDLLFLSPDLLTDVRGTGCVRTIYLTAGDSGQNSYYWLGREQGSQLAYSSMTPAIDDQWVQRIVRLDNSRYINIATPRGNPNISLIFFRLPDGNLNGQGFRSMKYESLAHLKAGWITSMHSVDGQSSYTSEQLQMALVSLLDYYSPDTVRTQSTQRYFRGVAYTDHSDHITTGYYAAKAFAEYKNHTTATLSFYNGYPIRGLAANVSGDDLQAKEAAFLTYAQKDGGVCHSVDECSETATYNAYLQRQYQAKY